MVFLFLASGKKVLKISLVYLFTYWELGCLRDFCGTFSPDAKNKNTILKLTAYIDRSFSNRIELVLSYVGRPI